MVLFVFIFFNGTLIGIARPTYLFHRYNDYHL